MCKLFYKYHAINLKYIFRLTAVSRTVAKDNLTDSALNISKILSCAEGNTKKAQEKMKRMSLKSSMQKFNVGDMVWRLNIRSR